MFSRIFRFPSFRKNLDNFFPVPPPSRRHCLCGRGSCHPLIISKNLPGRANFLKCCRGGVWGGEAPPGISVTRAIVVVVVVVYASLLPKIADDGFPLQGTVTRARDYRCQLPWWPSLWGRGAAAAVGAVAVLVPRSQACRLFGSPKSMCLSSCPIPMAPALRAQNR